MWYDDMVWIRAIRTNYVAEGILNYVCLVADILSFSWVT